MLTETKGEHIPHQEVVAAQESMQYLSKVFKWSFGHDSKFIKGVDNLGKTFANTIENSKAFSDVAVELGYDVQRLYDAKKAYSDMAKERENELAQYQENHALAIKQIALSVMAAQTVERVIRGQGSLLAAVPQLLALTQKKALMYYRENPAAVHIRHKAEQAGMAYKQVAALRTEASAKYKESQPHLKRYLEHGARPREVTAPGGGSSLQDAVASVATNVGILTRELRKKTKKPVVINARLHAKGGDQVFSGQSGAPGMSLLPPYL